MKVYHVPSRIRNASKNDLIIMVMELLDKADELEVYKRALEISCEDIKYIRCDGCRLVDDCYDCKTCYDYVKEYLKKAKE